jgi:microcystin-dependent protein
MPLTTPIYGLPYPQEADVADVPHDVRALAQRLETVLPLAMPSGCGCDWYTATAPSGFLLCDGSAVSRTTYAALFGILGTTWGTGDGSTTFNLPDCRGRVLVCRAAGGNAEVATIAGNDGTAIGSRRVKHAHTNGVSATPSLSASHNLSLPDHAHGFNQPYIGCHFYQGANGDNPPYFAAANINSSDWGVYNFTAAGGSVAGVTSTPGINGGVTVGGSVSIGGTIGVTGGTADGPSYVVANKIIKT